MINKREVVAGGPDDFMTVHHLTITGSQIEIGNALATEARTHYSWTPQPADPTVSRARRAWFERNWPQHYARMIGAAQAIGAEIERDEVHLDGLTGVPTGSGCSATWFPPSSTVERHGLMGRNYDMFTIGMQQMFAQFADEPGPEHEPPMASRPYVITTIPDDGPASTMIAMNGLDECTEGINEHGLAIVLLIADAETVEAPVEAGPQVGLNASQLPWFVLDTCKNVDEAKRALLGAKHYDYGMPLHYLIADASGRAFVWERGHGGVEHIIESDAGALCVTNHLLHQHRDPADLPEDNEESLLTYERARTLAKRTHAATISGPRLRELLDEVRFEEGRAGKYPLRTLWRTVFDLDNRTMTPHFYLGDDATGQPRYSAETTFRLRRAAGGMSTRTLS